MIRVVYAIWACDFFTRAFGCKCKLPWEKCTLDLDILDKCLSSADHIIGSRKLISTLPKSFKDKWPNIIEVSTENPIEKQLLHLTGQIYVLGGRSLFKFCIENKLLDVIIENNIGFFDRRLLEYDTVAPIIDCSKYEYVRRYAYIDHQCAIRQNIWEKIR